MEKELKDQRITIMLTESELRAVDDWSFAHRIRSRGEAIRQLIDGGLLIPTLASIVTSNIGPAATYDDPQLASSAKALDAAIDSHFQKVSKAAEKNMLEAVWIGRLTKNEREVMEAIASGKTERDIAEMLGISEHTVKWYVAGIRSQILSDTPKA
ncbi:helix-turn-helix transcriptional regulator [Agrobacterium tumefaciens]|uniref:helix-turn-helix transcriptional regulator n=1 Tax=Agrobacterium tumefaciens TaxID=358 RepID=UPI001574B5B9|nr:hypothetical protein [Agrobacterium tumefaciens]